MEPISDTSSVSLDPQHLAALRWFDANRGRRLSWPEVLPGGLLLATRAKGIYKPKWTQYALSVRAVLDGPYEDGQVRVRADGTWALDYCQEGHGEQARRRYVNKALALCARDRVPVGVLLQLGAAEYLVQGLAVVRDWIGEVFLLEEWRALPRS